MSLPNLRKRLVPLFLSSLLSSSLFSTLNGAQNPLPPKLPLQIGTYIELVIENNLQVRLSELEVAKKRAIYEEQVKLKSGGNLTASYNEKYTDEITRKSRNLNINWKYKILDSGTQLGLDFKQRQSRANVLVSEQWTSEFGLNITQSLLPFDFQNFRLRDNRQVDVFRFDIQIERAKYNLAVEQLVQKALAAYWEYVIYREEFVLSSAIYQDSKALFDFNKRKERLGTFSQNDLLASEALLLKEEMQLDSARKRIERLEQTLLNFMGYELPKQGDTFQFVVNKLSPPVPPVPETSESAYETALVNRSDLSQIQISALAAENALAIGKLSLQPTVNLLFGTSLFNTDPNYSCAFCGFKFDSKHVDLSWGLTFFMYTDLLSYKVPTARPLMLIEQAQKTYQNKKNAVRLEIKEKLRAINLSYQSLIKNGKILQLQERRYQLGLKDYNQGKIGAAQRVQYRNDLRNAQRAYLNSRYSYQVALINLEVSKGSLLETYSLPKLNPNDEVKEVR